MLYGELEDAIVTADWLVFPHSSVFCLQVIRTSLFPYIKYDSWNVKGLKKKPYETTKIGPLCSHG